MALVFWNVALRRLSSVVWAQVNQGNVADVDEIRLKLQYDFFYIKYFSPWLDILIVFRGGADDADGVRVAVGGEWPLSIHW